MTKTQMEDLALICLDNQNYNMFHYIMEKFHISIQTLVEKCFLEEKSRIVEIMLQQKLITYYNIAVVCVNYNLLVHLHAIIHNLSTEELDKLAKVSLIKSNMSIVNYLSKYALDINEYAFLALRNNRFNLYKKLEKSINMEEIMKYAEKNDITAESMIIIINDYERWKRERKENEVKCKIS